MQPEQQNSQPPSTGGSNIPDYLGMEPIVDPGEKNRKRKKRLIVIVSFFIIAVLIVVAVMSAVMYSRYYSPESRFYRVIHNMMDVDYIAKSYVIDSATLGVQTSVDVESDLRMPAAPKSHLAYTNLPTTTESDIKSLKGEIVVTGEDNYFSKIETASDSANLGGVLIDQWYAIQDNTISHRTYDYDLDSLGSRTLINSPFGVLISGKFSADQRMELENYVKENQIYILTDVESKTKNGKDQTVYTVTIDREGLNGLNKRASSLLRLGAVYEISTSQPETSTLELWVDNATETISQIRYVENEDREELSFMISIAYSYPDRLEIKEPDNIQKLPGVE